MEKKPHINIGTIGHVDHGKTTLTAAITVVLNKKYSSGKSLSYADIDNAPEEKARGITINQRTVNYKTDNRDYAHVDCPGHADYVKNMITGTSQMDYAILVVSAADGLSQQTKEHVILASQIGIRKISIFFTKKDLVPEEDMWLVDEVIAEVQTYLKSHGYDGPYVTAIGSPVKVLEDPGSKEAQETEEAILKFFEEMESQFELPERQLDKPFLMCIDSVCSIPGRGTVVTGCVERGTLLPNSPVEIIGGKKPVSTTVTGMQAFHKDIGSADAGNNVGLLLRGVTAEQVGRGMVVAQPNTVKTYTKVKALFLLTSKEEGGRHSPIFSGYRPQAHVRGGDFTAVITLLDANGKPIESTNTEVMMMPGTQQNVILTFEHTVPIEDQLRMTIREGGKTVGGAVVMEILE